MQQLLIWSFSFYSLSKKALILRETLGENSEKVRKSARKCRNDFALQLLPHLKLCLGVYNWSSFAYACMRAWEQVRQKDGRTRTRNCVLHQDELELLDMEFQLLGCVQAWAWTKFQEKTPWSECKGHSRVAQDPNQNRKPELSELFFPETEHGTGTAGTVFEEPKPELSFSFC